MPALQPCVPEIPKARLSQWIYSNQARSNINFNLRKSIKINFRKVQARWEALSFELRLLVWTPFRPNFFAKESSPEQLGPLSYQTVFNEDRDILMAKVFLNILEHLEDISAKDRN